MFEDESSAGKLLLVLNGELTDFLQLGFGCNPSLSISLSRTPVSSSLVIFFLKTRFLNEINNV